MKTRRTILMAILMAALVLAFQAAAEPPKDAEAAEALALDPVKRLAGDWVEVDDQGNPADQVVLSYKVTAGGSAVREVIFGGTEHEMVTMYYQDGDDLVLTHYCLLGNQPRMRARSGTDPNQLVFDCIGGTNLSCSVDKHMHRGTITWVNEDRIRSEWREYTNGENTYTVSFNLARKQD